MPRRCFQSWRLSWWSSVGFGWQMKSTVKIRNMHHEKRLSKEDTWRPADLRKYVREDGSSKDNRKMDEGERRHRVSKSTERHNRDPDSRLEREKHRERRDVDQIDRYAERHKDVSQDRRKETDRDRGGDNRERRHESEVGDNRHGHKRGDHRDHRRQTEERHERERHRDREKDRVRDRGHEGDQSRRREEREREKRREERDKERRSERRKHEERDEVGQDRSEKHKKHRDRERNIDEYEMKRSERERRHKEEKEKRRHSERREKEVHKEERRKDREEQERTSIDRRHRRSSQVEDKEKRGDKYKEYIETKVSSEVRSHRSHRELSEFDKHKERREREVEEEGKNSSKKSSSQMKRETEPSKTELANEEDLTAREYEDDFEDYEEDFEEVDESESEEEKERGLEEETTQPMAEISEEIQVIQRAMDEENQQVRRSTSTHRSNEEHEERQQLSGSATDSKHKSSQHGKFIDFVAAKQREINKMAVSKQKKRSTELLRLIDLDFSRTFSHLDLPPVNEYDMYIRSFGSANTRQAYVQCNEDNAERDIQTEEIEVSEKWTQHPPEHSGACGDPNLRSEDKTQTEVKFDTQSLTIFLRSAAQVAVVLLEEDQAEKKSLKKQASQTDLLSFSDGGLHLNTQLPFLHGRHISLIHFSKDQRHMMVSVHKPGSEHSTSHLDSCTIMCIWNIWEPSRPQKILVYESEVQCCCFSPGKASLVFAGTSVGSVALWDLREHAGHHHRLKIGEEEWTIRQPTFCTDAVMANAAHFSCVTSLEIVPSTAAGVRRPEVPLLTSEEESAGLSLQLASLDESGVLNFWVVVQLSVSNEAGSQTDLGLRPGGKVKLLHSSSRQTAGRASTRDVGGTGATSCLQLKFHPTDANHFFIGTNMGLVTHRTMHGVKASPRSFTFMDLDVRPVDVSAIDFSPFRPDMFLVGCGDGSIRLHTVGQEQPLSEWKSSTSGEALVALQWNQTKSTVFCVLDAASNIYIWDLLQSKAEPVITERISADRVTAMCVFGDSAQQNPYSGVALAHESGKIELHHFTRTFTSPSEEETLDRIMKETL
ncbi:cytoplasmic dynein 2 intermediate chain 1 isoform X1 [Synchiropus splendidus]|uniref:cytoplasmic dynein 2 intermediate chain 1 isoform X1 n=1 Tax=Synchiropus splendidus TaxID=270530 RepID=UPI00237D82B8|nr:cytoplasmic dynein 2 intermediate chain 1 isoform X1 [Synchiropus splendidus]